MQERTTWKSLSRHPLIHLDVTGQTMKKFRRLMKRF
jgi:hypothetical protein